MGLLSSPTLCPKAKTVVIPSHPSKVPEDLRFQFRARSAPLGQAVTTVPVPDGGLGGGSVPPCRDGRACQGSRVSGSPDRSFTPRGAGCLSLRSKHVVSAQFSRSHFEFLSFRTTFIHPSLHGRVSQDLVFPARVFPGLSRTSTQAASLHFRVRNSHHRHMSTLRSHFL